VGGLSRCESRFCFSFEACQGRRCRLRPIRLNAEEEKANRHAWDVLIDQEGTGKIQDAAPTVSRDGPDRRARSQVIETPRLTSNPVEAPKRFLHCVTTMWDCVHVLLGTEKRIHGGSLVIFMFICIS
jgi:hypothetical protein